MQFSPRFIPEIPAARVRGERLASKKEELALFFDAQRVLSVRRVEELLSTNPEARAWLLEPIDWFPHFERDVTAFFENQLWQREGMGLSPLEVAAMVPIVCMLAATERWVTGTLTTTGLPPEVREAARDSNLAHENGMLDIVDEHFENLLQLLGSIAAMRLLASKITGHDLLEYPWGDHGRSVIMNVHSSEAAHHERRKKDEEAAALKLILEHTRGGIYATTLKRTLQEYENGKPKHYTFETAHRGDLTAFLVKLIDHVQGTTYGRERIFPYYGDMENARPETPIFERIPKSHFDVHIDDGLNETESIVHKILQLVASNEREKLEIALDTVVDIAGNLLLHLGRRRFGPEWTITDVRTSLYGFIDERDGLIAMAAE